MVLLGLLLAVPVVIVLIVLIFCLWLVWYTGKAEAMREVPPVLHGLQDLLWAPWRR